MCLTVDLVKRCGRLILCLGIVAGLLGLAGQDCLAKVKVDRYFVDAQNNTGYYIDVNSIEVVSDHEILVDMYCCFGFCYNSGFMHNLLPDLFRRLLNFPFRNYNDL